VVAVAVAVARLLALAALVAQVDFLLGAVAVAVPLMAQIPALAAMAVMVFAVSTLGKVCYEICNY
jgi:hypothetical protein